MNSNNPVLRTLNWLGMQGTRGVAVAMLSATALPGLGDTFRPLLGEAVFALLTIAFVRLQPEAMLQHLRRPGLVVLACVWTTLAIPVLSALLYQWLAIDSQAPHLYLALMLQAIASPMMAAPAIVMLLGLDATIVLIVMVASTVVLPLTAAVFAHLFITPLALGPNFDLQASALGLRLFLLLAGSAAIGYLIRRTLGEKKIIAHKAVFDGLNILMLFVFAAAVMGVVVPALIEQPLHVVRITAMVFAVFIAIQVASTVLFWRAGRDVALGLGFMCSQRNMGIMLVAITGVVSQEVWLYFAMAQLPIYLGPMLLTRFVRRFV